MSGAESAGAASWGLFLLSAVTWRGLLAHGKKSGDGEERRPGYDSLVGHTPLVELQALSAKLGRRLFVKMESSNPGGTGKDRAVKRMLDHAELTGVLRAGMTVFEGTSGSTGIALAFQCRARGYQLHVVMPDDQAEEKRRLLQNLGAKVTVVPCCSIANQDHYVNKARSMASDQNGFFCDQFENTANADAHFECTGPEIWSQMEGSLDAFVMSSGTGGTISGVSRYLKARDPSVRVVLADPTGSSLRNKVLHNVCYTNEQAERRVRKHRYDSIVEGVGLDRVTANFALAAIDDAFTAGDQAIVDMAHALLNLEGLFVGSSSALNLCVACKVAAGLPEGSKVVTIICDHGSRHLSRFWSQEYITESAQLQWPGSTPKERQEWERAVGSYAGTNISV